jgi:fatty acid desaturase
MGGKASQPLAIGMPVQTCNRKMRCAARHARYRAPNTDIVEKTMTIDRAVLVFAGAMVLLSAALVYWVSIWWLLLTVFIGLNMIQSAFSGFCPAAKAFKKFGVPPGVAFKK